MTETTPTVVETETEIVIGIPGKWADRRELSHALNLAMMENIEKGGYLMLGHIIANAKANSSFEVTMDGHNENMQYAFECAGNGRLDQSLLDEIGEHTSTLYIISKKTGLETAKELVAVASAVLKAGGLAVKVETTGIAHSKETWLAFNEKIEELPQMFHFLTIVPVNRFYTTFGMRTFGLPDVAVPETIDETDAIALINSFVFYRLDKQPVIESGETYSNGIDAPFYVMDIRKDDRYGDGDVFENPFGVIYFEPMERKAEKKKRSAWKRFLGDIQKT